MEGRHNAVTYFNPLDCRPHACDNTAELVAEDITFLKIWDGIYKSGKDTASVNDTASADPLTLHELL